MEFKNLKIIPISITPCLYFDNIELDHNKILDEIKKLPFKKISQETLSFNLIQKGIYISENETNIFTDLDSGQTMLNVFSNYISKSINNIYEYDIDFKLTTNWATKTEPNGIGEYHKHANFWLSGCYYPEGEIEDKLYICLKKPYGNTYQPNPKRFNNLNGTFIEIIIKKGTLLIFPAEIEHRIGYNNTNRNRYSIAFNILPKGKMGKCDGEYIF